MRSMGLKVGVFLVVTCAAGVSVQATRGIGAPKVVAPKVTDSDLTGRIRRRLSSSATLKTYDIDARVDTGVATLTGTVGTASQKSQAGRLARLTGVTKVNNDIVIDKSLDKTLSEKTKATADKAANASKDAASTVGDKTKETAETVGDKAKDALETAGDKTKTAATKTGANITDAWITTKVKTDFVGEETLKGSAINVDTEKHVVTLKGTVHSEAGRNRAAAIAAKTDGVSRVVNQLVITP
jgi:osmotically-inducible protein OsmY